MPVGKIKKVVHFTGQASRLQNVAAVPTRNAIGYGFVESGGETLYFDPSTIDCDFDELAVGVPVEFDRDAGFAVAAGVRPISAERFAAEATPDASAGSAAGAAAARPAPNAAAASSAPRTKSAVNSAPPSTADHRKPGAQAAGAQPPAAPRAKKAEEAPTLVLDDVRQCIFTERYRLMSPGVWRRTRAQPEIETYTTPVADLYAEPQATVISDSLCVVRLFDEKAVNLKRTTDYLADYTTARERADAALRAMFPGVVIEDSL